MSIKQWRKLGKQRSLTDCCRFFGRTMVSDTAARKENPKKCLYYSHYEKLINNLARANKIDEMEQMLLRLKADSHILPREFLFSNLIGFYSSVRRPKSAIKLFEEIPEYRCKRTVKSFNSLLKALLLCKEDDKVQKLLKESERFGPPDACTYSILINDLCSNGKFHSAMKMCRYMESVGITPDVVTFTSIIHWLCIHSRIEEALNLKKEMLDVYHVQPDAHLYSSLMNGILKVGRSREIDQLWNEILLSGCKLNPVLYNVMINRYCKERKFRKVFQILDEMFDVGCQPDVVSYNTILSGLSSSSMLEEAFKLKKDMVNICNVQPNANIYTTLMDGLLKSGRSKEIDELWSEMVLGGCKPDVISYNIMIQRWCKEREFKKAFQILDEMVEKGCKPDSVSFTTILSELCKDGKFYEAYELFCEMPRQGCIPNQVTCRIMFDGLVNSMKIQQAFLVLNGMILKGFEPHSFTLEMFIHLLSSKESHNLLFPTISCLIKGNYQSAEHWKRYIL